MIDVIPLDPRDLDGLEVGILSIPTDSMCRAMLETSREPPTVSVVMAVYNGEQVSRLSDRECARAVLPRS